MFDLNNPPVHTPLKSDTPIFPQTKLYQVILILFVICQLPIYIILYVFFWLLSSKMMLKRQSGEPVAYKIENNP